MTHAIMLHIFHIAFQGTRDQSYVVHSECYTWCTAKKSHTIGPPWPRASPTECGFALYHMHEN